MSDFRGTRISNKQAKLHQTEDFLPVDISRVDMDLMMRWVDKRVTELLGHPDEVAINLIRNLLEEKMDGKNIQIQLEGFLLGNTKSFMKELWSLLRIAQHSSGGVPPQFLNEMAAEIHQEKAIQNKREKERRNSEVEKNKMTDEDAGTSRSHCDLLDFGLSSTNLNADKEKDNDLMRSFGAKNSGSYRSKRNLSPRGRKRSNSPSPGRRRPRSPSPRKHMTRSPSPKRRRRSPNSSRNQRSSPQGRRSPLVRRRPRSPSPGRRRRRPRSPSPRYTGSPKQRRRSPSSSKTGSANRRPSPQGRRVHEKSKDDDNDGDAALFGQRSSDLEHSSTQHLNQEGLKEPEEEEVVTLTLKYRPVLDYLAKNAPVKPYTFSIGSEKGQIPATGHVKTTCEGTTIMDGFVGHIFKAYDLNKSYGDDYEPSHMLVSNENPLHCMINKVPTLEASAINMQKSLQKLVDSVVKTRYIQIETPKKPEDKPTEMKPAYVEDFIDRVENLLKPKTKGGVVTPKELKERLRVIRHHPFLVQSAKRRLLLEDYYKFYKSISKAELPLLMKLVDDKCYSRWHVLIAPKDKILGTAYWKTKPESCPEDFYTRDYIKFPDNKEETYGFYLYTSEDGFLAVFLRNFLVHGTEEPLIVGIALEELELIIAYYFGRFLPSFLTLLPKFGDKPYGFKMPKEIMDVYEQRTDVSRAPLSEN